MAQTIRVGFVGLGWMGEQLLRRLHENPDSQLVAVYDINTERTASLLKEIGLSKDIMVDSYEAIVANPDVDAVFLVSPNAFHGKQSIAALEAGKHVFCEKPAATDFQDFLRQIELDKANDKLVTFVDYLDHFDPMEQMLKKLMTEQAFGQVTQIQANYRHPVNIAGDKTWKLRKEIVGDAIGMGPIHSVYDMHWLMAPAKPVSVYATSMEAKVRGFEVPPVWNIMIEFDTGASGIIQGNIDNGNLYDAYTNIYGTKGGFVYDSQTEREVRIKYWSESHTDSKWVYPLSETIAKRDGTTEHLWSADITMPDTGDVMDHQTDQCVAHFLDCVKKGVKSPLGFANTDIVPQISFGAIMSAGLKKPISLPLCPLEAQKFFAGK